MEQKEYTIGKSIWLLCICDLCNSKYDIKRCIERKRLTGKVINNRNLCIPCSKSEMGKYIAEVGRKALTSFSPEKKKEYARSAGKISANSPNSGRFNTERWNKMSPELQQKQVIRANQALHEKLKDPEYKAQHYAKIFSQMAIGHISKSHQELHESISELGFATHVPISHMQVDECNESLKIVIEYNGDYWHCNPETWKENDYNTAIKMYAKDKWRNDLNRRKVLNSLGYYVIVVWESDWKSDKDKCINYIKNKINEITEKGKNRL
jgi:very-short-patch-repair endonuclease